MSTKYIHLKKPPRTFLQKRKDFSRQASVLSQQINVNNITYQSSKDLSKKNVLNFQSIYDYLYPHSVKKPVKSQRKYFKSISDLEMSQIKEKIQLQNKKRAQKSLKSILLSHLRSKTQRNQEKKQPSRQISFTKRIINNNQIESLQNGAQKNLLNMSEKIKEGRLLESTNFSVRAISCQSNIKMKDQNKIKPDSNSILTKRNENKSLQKRYFQTQIFESYDNNKPQNIRVSNAQSTETQIQIKLSIKSMTKSEQCDDFEASQANRKVHKDEKAHQKMKNAEGQLISQKSFDKKIKNHLSTKNTKHSHMLIRFDKRMLLSRNQINDPCIKIERIKSISSRTLKNPKD